jgi:hypothetical protein
MRRPSLVRLGAPSLSILAPAPNSSPSPSKPRRVIKPELIAPDAIGAESSRLYAGKPEIELLFDSGAYSAWRLGKPVQLNGYIDYLLANKQWMQAYISLDIINPDDPERAAADSHKAYLTMREAGLDPIPVFHAREDFKWLGQMLKDGASYIALAGLSLNSHKERSAWYRYCWDMLCDGQGRPLVKVHALGEGRYSALSCFPWYSADSTSWLYSTQRNAQLSLGQGKSISMRNDALNERSAQDVNSLEGPELAYFEHYLAERGISSKDAFREPGLVSTTLRTYLELQYYLDQERRVSLSCPILHRPSGLFSKRADSRLAGLNIGELRYYSVLGANAVAWSCLSFSSARRGLISYFYIADIAKGSFGAWSRKSNVLIDFLYKPVETCSTKHPMSKSWGILKEHIK